MSDRDLDLESVGSLINQSTAPMINPASPQRDVMLDSVMDGLNGVTPKELAYRRSMDPTKGIPTSQLMLEDVGRKFNEQIQNTKDFFTDNKPRIAADKKLNRPLLNSPGGGFGDIAVPMIEGAALPMKSVPKAIGAGGLLGLTDNADNWVDTAGNVATSGLGAGLGSAIGKIAPKTVAGLKGDWSDPNLKASSEMLNANGVPHSIGDLEGPGFMRTMENAADRAPLFGRQNFEMKQGQAALNKLDDGSGGIPGAMTRTYDAADAANATKWAALDKQLKNTPGQTNVRPQAFTAALEKFVDTYGAQALNKITDDKQLTARLQAMSGQREPAISTLMQDLGWDAKRANRFVDRAENDTMGLSFVKMRELQKAVGPMVGRINQSSVFGNASQDTANAIKGMYGSIYDDINRWNMNGKNKKLYSMFTDARDDMKNNVLPWEEDFSIFKKSKRGDYDLEPQKGVADTINAGNRGQVGQMVSRMTPADSEYLRIPKIVDRGVRTAMDPEGPKIATGISGLGKSMYGVANALPEMAGRTKLGKDFYFGNDYSSLPGASVSATQRGALSGLGAGMLQTPWERFRDQRE